MIGRHNAIEYLNYYLDQISDPDSAVLLEGPWGAGKSRFVEDFFKDRLAKAQLHDPLSADPLIHVTLFGVRDPAEITTQMFEKAHPILGGKTVKLINAVVSRAVGAVGVSADAKENASLLQDLTLKLDGRVLVFDDLERSHLPLVEVMGYINRYVEHSKLKVIVVASEADIPPMQRSDYFIRKEKLIGKTIRVSSDPEAVLDAFLQNLQVKEVVETIRVNRADLLATFHASGKLNFRSLRAILFDFERLVDKSEPALKANAQALRSLLLYMLAVGMEFRSGDLTDETLRTFQEDLRGRLFGDTKTSTKKSKAQEISSKYDLVTWSDPIVPPTFLADLFSSGAIDASAVNAFLSQHPAVVGQRTAPAWRRLWSWSELSATEYREARDALISQLAAHEITHPGEILHVAGTSIRLKRFGDDLFGGETAVAFFKKYLEKLENDGSLRAAPELFGSFGGSHAALVYNENETEEFSAINKLVEAASARALDDQLSSKVGDLLNSLSDDSSDVSVLYDVDLKNGKYGGYPMLHHVDVEDFADLLIVDYKPNDKLFGALHQRFSIQYQRDLSSEYPWVAKLHKVLAQRVATAPPPHRQLCELRLDYWFGEINQHLPKAATTPSPQKPPKRKSTNR